MRSSFPESERIRLVDLAERTLWSDEGEKHLTYLRETRGISEKEIRALRFGYVPERFEGHELTGRIVMPLYDAYGRLVVITSRDIRPNSEKKHWHESFDKREHLYGLNLAKDSILRKKKAIVVEGQFDVGRLRTIGLDFVVGILGTSLTLLQTSLLARYCSDIYLFFDGDKGGREAVKRSMAIYKDRHLASFEISFMPINTPEGKDPDDFTLDEIISLCKKSQEDFSLARQNV